MKFLSLLVALLIGMSGSAFAEAPLKYKTWKEQQIVEAQNEVLRISARLHAQKNNPKTDKSVTADDLDDPSRLESSPVVTDKDLKSALETLQISKELTLEDYAEVYVESLQSDSPRFTKLMESLSREEMTQLMRILVKNKAEDAPDAKHSGAAADKSTHPRS